MNNANAKVCEALAIAKAKNQLIQIAREFRSSPPATSITYET